MATGPFCLAHAGNGNDELLLCALPPPEEIEGHSRGFALLTVGGADGAAHAGAGVSVATQGEL